MILSDKLIIFHEENYFEQVLLPEDLPNLTLRMLFLLETSLNLPWACPSLYWRPLWTYLEHALPNNGDPSELTLSMLFLLETSLTYLEHALPYIGDLSKLTLSMLFLLKTSLTYIEHALPSVDFPGLTLSMLYLLETSLNLPLSMLFLLETSLPGACCFPLKTYLILPWEYDSSWRSPWLTLACSSSWRLPWTYFEHALPSVDLPKLTLSMLLFMETSLNLLWASLTSWRPSRTYPKRALPPEDLLDLTLSILLLLETFQNLPGASSSSWRPPWPYLEHALPPGDLPKLDYDERVEHGQHKDGSKAQQDFTQDDIGLKMIISVIGMKN